MIHQTIEPNEHASPGANGAGGRNEYKLVSLANYCTIKVHTQAGIVCGYVKKGVFVRKFQTKQILRQPVPALALDAHVLVEIQEAGATTIRLENSETQEVYTCLVEHFIEQGFKLNRGFGPQVALPLSAFIRSKPGDGLRSVEQLALFREVTDG